MTRSLSIHLQSLVHVRIIGTLRSMFFTMMASIISVVSAASYVAAQTTQVVDGKVPAGMEVATFGGGCFWCVESVFENVDGVIDVVSGYSGGTVPNPTYEQVCTKLTGHVEVCQITFDPKKISYLKLLEVFMKTHDPTKVDMQGPDRGPQYRSVIFYHSDEQKSQAQELISRLDEEKTFNRKIVTKVEPLSAFYLAEEYHQDYFRKNPNDAYCQINARPKIVKLKKVLQELEKKEKLKKGS
jgi:peptide-methionine (S)-S-oxide reductase